MNAPLIKTAAEQRLEWFENLGRPLTDEESENLRRALHAVYCRNRRFAAERELAAPVLAQHRAEERALYARMRAEAEQ